MSPVEPLGEWMDAALAGAPPELALRIRRALPDGWRDVSGAEAGAVTMQAAVSELHVLLERGCETRWAAPGLLTVDALVTHACELIARAGDDIESTCARVIREIVTVHAPTDETR